MNVIPETEKEWLQDPIKPFSFRTRLKNPIEQMHALMWMRTEAIVDWGASGGANTDWEGRRKAKEVKRRGEMKEK